jgi:hypothetical protein
MEYVCDNGAERTKGDSLLYKMPMAAGLQAMMMERYIEIDFNHVIKLWIYEL